jgi:hypothetical protein
MAQPTSTGNKTLEYAESIGLVPVTLSVARDVVQLCMYDRHVGLLISESSVGKTAVLRQLAQANGMEFKPYL